MTFFHLHAHSMYSTLDGMPSVESMVERAVFHGQPGLALTDHGNMSGATELYAHCRERGIKPFPGEEFYVVKDCHDKDAPRYHLTMVAFTNEGFESLVRLSSKSHERGRYHYKPRIDFADLAQLGQEPGSQGIAVLTGCWFGLLQQYMINADREQALGTGEAIVEMLTAWFPNVFIEVQSHGIERQDGWSEKEMIEALAEISLSTGTPLVATQDSHYVDVRDRKLHDLMKRIAYMSTETDVSFPGDSYHLSSGDFVKSHYEEWPEIWQSTLDVCEELLERHDLTIDAIDNYAYYVPQIGKNPMRWLTSKTGLALKERGLTTPRYEKQLAHELAVIRDLGMAGYFRLIYEGVKFCNEKGIFVRARGSASGSLVCYLLGITAVDPIEWDLTFERFLSPDRKKPPDIDLDIEDTRRDEVVEFYRQRFQVIQIGTYSTLGENEWGRGSVLVQYLSQKRRELGERFKDELGDVKYIDQLPDKRDRKMLHRLAELKVKKAAGAHAAGYVVGTKDRPIEKLIPTMLIPSSESTVTQYTMDEVERLGYIKIDLLGQRTLSTVKRCLELIGRDPADGLDWIPLDDRKTMAMLRQGRQDTGIFQLEGWTAAKGCREMAVKKTKDIIRVNALYRPATIASGYKDLYLSYRRDPSAIKWPPHPAFKKHLKATYGVAIFQEQIMAILRDMGVPYEELNQFLTALKLSNDKAVRAREIFRTHRSRFIKLCRSKWNMTKAEAVECWDSISGFAGYGFNAAHATAYGLLGYQAAYLKTHYTLEYMAALLETTSGTPKEKVYVQEARRLNITLYTADVNRSKVSWRLDGDGIRKGLLSIKGVGERAAASIVANAPYVSMEDLIERTDARAVNGGKEWAKTGNLKGVLEALRKGGALRSLGVDPYG